VSPDGLPYLGKVPGTTNLFAATGHSMLGLSLGPVTGRLAAELLAGRQPSLNIAALAVARFG
jgi:D-amino-acid dehydrogenase